MEIHQKAIQSLLIAYPSYCIPIVIWAIESSDIISLGSRLIGIESLIEMSYQLAGIKHNTSINNTKIDEIEFTQNQEITNNSNRITNTVFNNSKTIIKRPAKLKHLKNKKIYIHNNFIIYATICYRSIMKILLNSLETLHTQFAGKSIVDGFETHLPTKLLQAITAFTRCSINTNYQR